MARNPLNKNAQPHEIIKGDKLINLKRQRCVVINGHEMEMEVSDTIPDGNGNYVDMHKRNIPTDWAGTPYPENPEEFLGFSHTGAVIKSSEMQGTCTSLFHPHNRSTFVLLGLDGRRTANGGVICSYCQFRQTTFYVIIGLFVLGIVLGLFDGVGLFPMEINLWGILKKIG